MKKEYPYSTHINKLNPDNTDVYLDYYKKSKYKIQDRRAMEYTEKEKAYFNYIKDRRQGRFDDNSGEPNVQFFLGRNIGLPGHSGMQIFSKYPIRAQNASPFKNKHVAISDSVVAKGIVYAKIDLTKSNKGIKYAHIFNWHPSPYVPMKYDMYKGALGKAKTLTDIFNPIIKTGEMFVNLITFFQVGTLSGGNSNMLDRFVNAVTTDFRHLEMVHINQIEETVKFINKCLTNAYNDEFNSQEHAIFITGDSNIARNDVWEYHCNIKKVQNIISKKKTESEMKKYNKNLLQHKIISPNKELKKIKNNI